MPPRAAAARTTTPVRASSRTARVRRCAARAAASGAQGAEHLELQPHELQSAAAGAPPRLLVAGFGSLLSERSARGTFPELSGFRVGTLRGFRRVFAHACDVFVKNGIADLETLEMASLSVEPCAGAETLVTLFSVPGTAEDAEAFVQREHEFRFLNVTPTEADGSPCAQQAVVCAAYSDEEYKALRCAPGEFEQRYTSRGIDKVWGWAPDEGLLPCRVYLRHCLLAAKGLGEHEYDAFVDGTFLSDRKTTIREHLERFPEIMTELPPPALAVRYGG